MQFKAVGLAEYTYARTVFAYKNPRPRAFLQLTKIETMSPAGVRQAFQLGDRTGNILRQASNIMK